MLFLCLYGVLTCYSRTNKVIHIDFLYKPDPEAINADGILLVAISHCAAFLLLFCVFIGQCRRTQIYHLACVFFFHSVQVLTIVYFYHE